MRARGALRQVKSVSSSRITGFAPATQRCGGALRMTGACDVKPIASRGTKVFSGLRIQSVARFAVLAAALLMGAEDADVRPAGGLSFGGGLRAFAPPVTAPAAEPSKARRTVVLAQLGPAGYPEGSLSGLFSRPGLLGGFAGGFLGSGLLGLLFGHGLWGGLGGAASYFGLLFQLALLAMLGRLIWTWWRGSRTPAFAALSPRQLADAYIRSRDELAVGGDSPPFVEIKIGDSDHKSFVRLLGEVEAAYGREDLDALRTLVTPPMMGYFSQRLARNAGRGVVNLVSDVRLITGDLAEAWRERDIDYAAVAMHFSLIDRTVDRASGRVVEGSESSPTEAAQVWTFSRTHGDNWLLSAIQPSS
jgi:predicted lipid-binding transport protein (Tim44 family)